MDVSLGGIVTANQIAPSSYPAKYTFKNGVHVSLEAAPDHRYLFNNWGGDLTGTANPCIIVISCDQNVTANFSPNKTLLVEFLSITALIGLLIVASIIVRYRSR